VGNEYLCRKLVKCMTPDKKENSPHSHRSEITTKLVRTMMNEQDTIHRQYISLAVSAKKI
jgi:hypothetical protein